MLWRRAISPFAYFLSIPTTIVINLKVDLNTNIKTSSPLMMINTTSILLITTTKSIHILVLLFIRLTCRLSTTPFHIHMVISASSAQIIAKTYLFIIIFCIAMLIAPIITGYLYDLTNIETGFVTVFLEVIAIFMMSWN